MNALLLPQYQLERAPEEGRFVQLGLLVMELWKEPGVHPPEVLAGAGNFICWM